jgi:hypothetical protein
MSTPRIETSERLRGMSYRNGQVEWEACREGHSFRNAESADLEDNTFEEHDDIAYEELADEVEAKILRDELRLKGVSPRTQTPDIEAALLQLLAEPLEPAEFLGDEIHDWMIGYDFTMSPSELEVGALIQL